MNLRLFTVTGRKVFNMPNFFEQFHTPGQPPGQPPGQITQPTQGNFFAQFGEPLVQQQPETPSVGATGSFDQEFIQPLTMKQVVSQAVGNIPKSAEQFVKDMVTPFLEPKETAKAFVSLGKGLGQKLIPGKQEDEEIVDSLVEVMKDRYGGVENIKKTLAEDPVGFVADISSLLIPGGAVTKSLGVVSKVEKIGKVGKVISKVGEALEPTTAIRKVTKEVVKKAIPKELPGKLYKSAAKFSTVLPEKTRRKLASTALDNRIMPTLAGLDKLREKIDKINVEISDLIDTSTASGKRIPVDALFTNLKQLRHEARLTGEPITNRRMIDNIAKQMSIANKRPGTLTPTEVQKLKQRLYKETESLYDKSTQKPIKGEAKQAIARSAKESLEKIFPEIKELNRQDGSLIALRKEIEKSASRISNRDIAGIGVPIKGGAGGVVGGKLGMAIGLGIGLLDTPTIKAKLSIVANSLKKKGVVLADDSLLKQYLEIAPGLTAVQSRLAGKLKEINEND